MLNENYHNHRGGLISRDYLPGALILLFAVLVYFGNTYKLHLERWDDAYITFRFAQNFAAGQGFIWNAGGEPVEGFTSFLHVLLLAFGIKAGIDPWLGSLIISLISVLATTGMILLVFRRQFGSLHPVAAAFVGIFLIDFSTSTHTTSGLETQLFIALLCACYLNAFVFIEKQSWQTAISLGVLTFLSCLSRPEAVIYNAGLYFALAVYSLSSAPETLSRQEKLLRLSASAVIFVILGLIYAAWKYSYFGYILPNPYYVKSNKFSLAGLPEVTDYIKHLIKWLAPLAAAGIFLIFADKLREEGVSGAIKKAFVEPLSFLREPQARAKFLLTLFPPLLALAYYCTIIHEVGGAFRFSYPTYFYFVLACGIFLQALIGSTRLKKITEFSLLTVAAVWLALLFVWQKSWRISPIPPSPFGQFHTKIGEALKSTGLGYQGTVLCDAAGVIPYISGFNQVDRVGLVDNFLSGRKPAPRAEREAYIWSRPIDVYFGNEPPAEPGAESPEVDSQMKSQYVSEILLKRQLALVESRIFLQDPQLLHARMRELRDNWYLLGETSSPAWKAWKLKSFVYVRRNSLNAELLISKLGSLIDRQPAQINLNDIH
jgi:hypothetical protein